MAAFLGSHTGAPVDESQGAVDANAILQALDRHKMSEDHNQWPQIWQKLGKFLSGLETSGLMPIGETADIGTALRMFRKLWVSELTTLIFRKGNVLVMDGMFVLTKQSGKFAADVAAGDTQIDFGQALTVGDYLLLRAENKMEYMQVGSLVDGTTYNVTRNLDGSGANDWPRESVYFVRGHEGDGWLELTAVDEQRLSVFIQGQNWDQTTEIVRIGLLDGWQGAGITGHGIAIGNYDTKEYIRFTTDDLKMYSSGEFVAANDLARLWQYGLDLFTDYSGIRFYKTLSDQSPIAKIILFTDPGYPERTQLHLYHDSAAGLYSGKGGPNATDGYAGMNAYGGLSGGSASVICVPGQVKIDVFGKNGEPGNLEVIFNRDGLALSKNIAAANISQTPIEDGILQAGADKKISSGWLPDLSFLYLPINGKAADSDYLDGKDSSYFAAANHNHAGDYLPINGKAADAEKLDGLDSTQFERASDWLSWTPTCTGWSSYTARRGRYRVQGKTLFFVCEIRGTSNATSATITLPAGLRSANVISTGVWPFAGIGVDNGVSLANPIRGNVANNSTVINLYKDFGGANWTASGGKQAIFSGWCEIA